MNDPLAKPNDEKTLARTKDAAAIRAMFDRISPTYDLLNHVLSFNADRYWRWVTATKLMDALPQRVLDVCCGTGDLALAIVRAAQGHGHDVACVATDFAPTMVQRAARKFRRAGKAGRRCSVAIADTLRLPFPDSTFDAVTVAFGIRNVANFDEGLRELARVTRDGGRVVVLEFSRPSRRWFVPLYRFYSFRFMPWVGRIISGSRAYGYLPASVDTFPSGEDFLRYLQAACGGKARQLPLTFGIATLYMGIVRKASPGSLKCGLAPHAAKTAE